MQVIGIATRYGLDGPGIKSRWGKDFPHPSRTALGPTQLSVYRTPSLPEVKRVGCRVDHPTHLAPRLKKEESYTCTSPLRLHGLFQGKLYFYLYGVIIVSPTPVACCICCTTVVRKVLWLASWRLSFWESCNCYTSVWHPAVVAPVVVNTLRTGLFKLFKSPLPVFLTILTL